MPGEVALALERRQSLEEEGLRFPEREERPQAVAFLVDLGEGRERTEVDDRPQARGGDEGSFVPGQVARETAIGTAQPHQRARALGGLGGGVGRETGRVFAAQARSAEEVGFTRGDDLGVMHAPMTPPPSVLKAPLAL